MRRRRETKAAPDRAEKPNRLPICPSAHLLDRLGSRGKLVAVQQV
ncbi:hypothetical protein ACPEIC_14430 [Stenotrophomonas sp. NPDC087984]